MSTLWHNEKLERLGSKLDLNAHVANLASLFAREKSVVMRGDRAQHAKFINALDGFSLPKLPPLENMDDLLNRLSKEATLQLEQIYLFVQQIHFFNRLKAASLPPVWVEYLQTIEIPQEIADIAPFFNDEGLIDSAKDSELYAIEQALSRLGQEQKGKLAAVLGNSKVQEYLVDTQIHYYYGQEALLVRGGFSKVLKAGVIGRSSGGFFYVVPDSLESLKRRRSELLDAQAQIYQKYAKEFSALMHKWWRFLLFLNREFDRVDHYNARAQMVQKEDLHLILPIESKEIILEGFAHPAIKDPKPISIAFKNRIMLVTGVNAGGKTMLLKSLLSAVLMSKYLIPFRTNPHKSSIGTFENIEVILDDPQSVKNDISTFAGRIGEFNRLFKLKDTIVGVDEIELGTDADEAAALFRVLLEELSQRGIYFIITTHHKRLASLMASNKDVELVAAVYDEQQQCPTYTYLSGSIGKSYAFETAQRYGINKELVQKSREYLGQDKEQLSSLIEKSTQLEIDMRKKQQEAKQQLDIALQKQQRLDALRQRQELEYKKRVFELEKSYASALAKLQEALKKADNPDARRLINKAHADKKRGQKPQKQPQPIELRVGQSVQYRGKSATVVSLKSKEAMIDVGGIKMHVPKGELKAAQPPKKEKSKKVSVSVRVNKPQHSKIVLKLLGMRADEASEAVQNFLSDALVHGFNEVEIIHGTGSGVLIGVVSELLKRHPKVKSFERVRGNLGATLVKL